MPEEWVVPPALDGERVDRGLALITGLSRREVNAVLEGGQVSIAGRAVTTRSRKLRTGERLVVAGELPERGPDRPVADAAVGVPVVWFDDQVIVVDKPAGLVVHPGAGNREGTLVHGLLARFPDLAAMADDADQRERPGIVQRLDKGTSGLMVVARTAPARSELVRQLAGRQVERTYLSLVAGSMDAEAGLVDAPLGRSDRDPTRIRVQAGGRAARTRYEVEARYVEPAVTTLLRCQLETGRTHQIRVHLATIGHPVVGDDRYGSRSVEGWTPLPRGRPFLHAAVLAFDHPGTRQRLTFSSALPDDLEGVVRSLRPAGPAR